MCAERNTFNILCHCPLQQRDYNIPDGSMYFTSASSVGSPCSYSPSRPLNQYADWNIFSDVYCKPSVWHKYELCLDIFTLLMLPFYLSSSLSCRNSPAHSLQPRVPTVSSLPALYLLHALQGGHNISIVTTTKVIKSFLNLASLCFPDVPKHLIKPI